MTQPHSFRFWQKKRIKSCMQGEASECGLACLTMIAGYHGYETDLISLRQRFSLGIRGMTLKNLVDIAHGMNFITRPIKIDLDDVPYLKLPCILHWNFNHFVVLERVECNASGSLSAVILNDPGEGKTKISRQQFSDSFTGIAMELTPAAEFSQVKKLAKINIGAVLNGIIGLKSAVLQIFALALTLEIFSLASPLFMQLIVDTAVQMSDKSMLSIICAGFLLLILMQVVIGAFRSWIVLYVSTNLKIQLISNTFAHLLKLPLDYFQKRHVGDVASRFNSVHTIQETLSTRTIEAFLDGILASTAVAVAFLYSIKLTLIIIASALIYFISRIIFYPYLHRASEEKLAFSAREQSYFIESVFGLQAVKLFNAEHIRHARWFNIFSEALNRDLQLQKLTLSFSAITALLFGFENIIVIWLGSLLVIEKNFTLGMLYAFIAYKTIFSTRAFSLIDKFMEFRMLSLQAERLSDILLAKSETDSFSSLNTEYSGLLGAVSDTPPTIELRKVSFRYSEIDPWVLRDISFTIQPHESIAIVGVSGGGKSTLLKLLTGLLQPTQGEIFINSIPLERYGTKNYRALFAAVMQDDNLFAGSIADNICFFDSDVNMTKIRECAEYASIAAEINLMPMGYQSLIGDMGNSLSGGQRQRLLLARALYKRPKILYLDEATSHLDAGNERLVNQALKKHGITKISVAHRQETIAMADRTIELADGMVINDTRCGADEVRNYA